MPWPCAVQSLCLSPRSQGLMPAVALVEHPPSLLHQKHNAGEVWGITLSRNSSTGREFSNQEPATRNERGKKREKILAPFRAHPGLNDTPGHQLG
jgi:hypothetical protein